MKTNLITGGAGFVGSNLAEALLKRGDRVIVLDNFSIGSRDNLADLPAGEAGLPQENLEIVEWDIRKPLDPKLNSQLSALSSDIDVIWNLACIASPAHYTKLPIETIETNTLGIPNVLMFAKSKGAKVLHTSTSEIYGDPKEHPQKETYWGNVNPRGSHAMYKEAKRIGETICTFYPQVYPEIDVRMVRIFNTYGPKMALNDGRMLSEFIHRALTGRTIEIHGDGSQTRSTCYVSDLVAGLIAMMDHADETRNDVINLGNPDEHSVQDFAEIVARMAGRGSKIDHIEARHDDVTRRCPDITKAKTILKWEPTVSLDAGLTKTMDWMKQKLATEANA